MGTLYWEELNNIFATNYIKEKLQNYGKVRLFGSAKKGRAFLNGHDFDVGLFTKIKSKDFIVKKVNEFIDEWMLLNRLPLHLYVYGDFSSQSFIKENKYLITFGHPFKRPLDYISQRFIGKWLTKLKQSKLAKFFIKKRSNKNEQKIRFLRQMS